MMIELIWFLMGFGTGWLLLTALLYFYVAPRAGWR